jgi:4-amino-4-deoxy-L-arabinose transferase-like glycosyltransferase
LRDVAPRRALAAAWTIVALVYLHNALPYLTMLPRVNVDEPWLMERAYQVLRTGTPRQPMYGLDRAYLLQPGYGYLFAPWLGLFGIGIFQARLLTVIFGGGVIAAAGATAARLGGPGAGLIAAVLLATDSNFLGGARDARTDMPALFFAALAIHLFIRERDAPARWFVASGVATALAMLCHGNSYWVAVTLLACYLVDHGRRPFARNGWAYLAGVAAGFGPYVAILFANAAEFQAQLRNFAGDRVPGLSPSFVWQQILREPERYRGWSFGLVTSGVPNPVLWSFQAAVAIAAVAIVVEVVRRRDPAARRPLWLSLALMAVPVVVFAGFINNKAVVYMPHLLLGFAIGAGVGVQIVSASLFRRRALIATAAGVIVFALAGTAYYERWYRSARKSELVPYEATMATIRTLVPPGPKLLVASPHFWVPYATESDVTFVSYAGMQVTDALHLARATSDRPTYLVVDETQWLTDLTPTATESTVPWRDRWVDYIHDRCRLEAVAVGTAYGNLALYRCETADHTTAPVRIVGGAATLATTADRRVEGPRELARWSDHVDPRPRRRAGADAVVDRRPDAVHLAGGNWPGIERYIDVVEGAQYLVTYDMDHPRPGDLLYIGRWERPEVLSLSGASAAGIAVPLAVPGWFPAMRGFIATAPRVRMLVYSEAEKTDLVVRQLAVTRLTAAGAPADTRR